jgi:hypothetical protein
VIKVTIELLSAITHRTTQIGCMYLANDGDKSDGTGGRLGDYLVGVCRRGSEAVPAPVNPDGQKPTRSGRVRDYPRNSYNVWRLIGRAIFASFPEERGIAAKSTDGDYAHDPASEATEDEARELGRELCHAFGIREGDDGQAAIVATEIGRRAWRRGARPNGMPEVA